MGAVWVDIMIDQVKFGSTTFFAISAAPFAMLSIICLLYLLIILGHVSASVFTIVSNLHAFVISFTMLYCILVKYYLFVKKEG
jgi:hypothetical protein